MLTIAGGIVLGFIFLCMLPALIEFFVRVVIPIVLVIAAGVLIAAVFG